MANTYTQIHIQAVFSVQNRDCIINDIWREELYKYITGIVQSNKHKLLAINGMPDHVHILFGLRPFQALSDLMQDIKGGSSRWINERKFIKSKFSWQEGYGAFSYGKYELPNVFRYIDCQPQHHQKKKFIDEYVDLLNEFEIDYNDEFIFRPVDVDYISSGNM
jgi:putative transposase